MISLSYNPSGIKIIGGKSEIEEGRDYGIFIRRIIPRGLAEQSGK